MSRKLELSILSIVMLSLFVFFSTAYAEPHIFFADTKADLTIFSYSGDETVKVYDSSDNLVWEGTVSKDKPQVISIPEGTYKCVGSSEKSNFTVAPGSAFLPKEGGTGGGSADDMFAGTGGGGTLKVICVPWEGNPFDPHSTYNGREITLCGTMKGVSGVTYSYSWDFGDGSSTPWAPVTDPYVLEAKHTYSGYPIGQNFTAKLKVNGSDGSSAEDNYYISVQDNILQTNVNIAVDLGLWAAHKYMYRWTQNFGVGDVDLGYVSGGDLSYTSQTMEAFFNHGHLVIGDPDEDPYVENVRRGINHILRNTNTYDVSGIQSAGYAEDYNNNGILDDGGNNIGLTGYDTYMYGFGLTLLAIASSGAPDWIAAPVGRANVDGRKYRDIVQDMVDFGVWSQNDYYSWSRGGWRYYSNYGDSDNSATQWPLLGIFAAEKLFGSKVPQWAKNETKDYWIPYSQGSDGGFGYTYAGYWENVAKTGAGLILLSWTGFPATDTRVTSAKQFIADRWNDYWDNNWYINNKQNYYAMYGVMKGCRLTNPQIVTLGSIDWYNEYANWLVSSQSADGWWYDNATWVGYDMASYWAICILAASPILKYPTAVLEVSPNPTDKGISVTFDGSKSYVHPGAPSGTYLTTYEFDFGDGTTYTETSGSAPDGAFDGKTTHTYANYNVDFGLPSGYPAKLKAKDSQPADSTPASVNVLIVPPDHAPTAVIEIISGAWNSGKPGIDYEAYSGNPIVFSASNSYDVDEKYGDMITAWDWDFTSPIGFLPVDATGTTATRTWTIPGTTEQVYEAGLRVTDNGSPSWTPPGPLQGFEFIKILILPRPLDRDPGKVIGAGWLVQTGYRRNLMVNVNYPVGGPFTSILVQYLNHSNRLYMVATVIKSMTIVSGTAIIKGDCKVNNAAGFTFELVINNTNPDSYALTIKNSFGTIVDSSAGTLAGGDFVVTKY